MQKQSKQPSETVPIIAKGASGREDKEREGVKERKVLMLVKKDRWTRLDPATTAAELALENRRAKWEE